MQKVTTMKKVILVFCKVPFKPICLKKSDKQISENGTEQISKYILMPTNLPSEYLNIFRLKLIHQMNIQTCSDAQEITKQICEHIQRLREGLKKKNCYVTCDM